MKKFTIITLLLSLAILGAGLLLTGSSTDNSQPADIQISESDWQKGPDEAQLTLVEYSDFQCPACAKYYPIVSRLLNDFDQLKVVYRHFPISQIHANAQLAAQAAEAAGRQGKFWQMHDKLFDFQTLWSESDDPEEQFISFAEDLELDVNQFKNDLKSDEIKSQVEEDYLSGRRLGVNSTPTFFLNGERLQNPANYEVFKSIIQSRLEN